MSKETKDTIKKLDDVVNDIKKSVYKSVLKSLRQKKRNVAQDIIEDIEDPNNRAQVDPDELPPNSFSVVNKSEKGVHKLKNFMVSRKEKLSQSR